MSRFVFTDESVNWCIVALRELRLHFESTPTPSDSNFDYPVYNMMADALEWLDERPESLLTIGMLKQLYTALLNARTTIILSEDSSGLCAKLLDQAALSIPAWTGLRIDRRSSTFGETFKSLQSSAMSTVEKELGKL